MKLERYPDDNDPFNDGYNCCYDKLMPEIERLREALWEIDNWSRAYPLKVFPEPDLAVAASVLKADGRVTLDAISASNMRHVVEGVGKIARRALGDEQSAGGKDAAS